MGHSIYKIDFDNQTHVVLYECIETMEEAEILAQFAMCNKRTEELIFITPGWNRSIDRYDPELYNRALQLAEEYKREKK